MKCKNIHRIPKNVPNDDKKKTKKTCLIGSQLGAASSLPIWVRGLKVAILASLLPAAGALEARSLHHTIVHTLPPWLVGGALRDEASNTYYEIFRISSWAFAAYIIILISVSARRKLRAAPTPLALYEVVEVRVNNPGDAVVFYINCNSFHTEGQIRLKHSQYIIAQLTAQALSLSVFSLASIPFFTRSPPNTHPLPLSLSAHPHPPPPLFSISVEFSM